VYDHKVADLQRDESDKQWDLDKVNDELKAANNNVNAWEQQQRLLKKRTAILEESQKIHKELNITTRQRNLLVSEWEAKHQGQKYHPPYVF